MKHAVLLGSRPQIERVFGLGRLEHLAKCCRLYPHIIDISEIDAHAEALADAEVVFSTWGCPLADEALLDRMPNLAFVFYAAGSVQGFARPLLARGVRLVSAWHANAVAVAEFTFAQIILANKGFFPNVLDCSTHVGRTSQPRSGEGNFERTVAVLGAGATGAKVIERLATLSVNTVVFDPFLPASRAAALGVEPVSLDEAFARGDVVTNHLANNPQTVGLIGRRQFELMSEHATFINTGRGATVDEAALIDVLRRRPNMTALLDVTAPEPPEAGSPLYDLPNCWMTSHIAGALGREVVRMADDCIASYQAWLAGDAPSGEVTAAMLDRLA